MYIKPPQKLHKGLFVYLCVFVGISEEIHPSIHPLYYMYTIITKRACFGPMKSIYLYHFLLNCSFGKCNKKSVISFYWNLWIAYDVFHQKGCNAILVKTKLKGILFSYAHLYKKNVAFLFLQRNLY